MGNLGAAALWSIGAVRSAAVVACACEALVAGVDGPSLRVLAGLTRNEADLDVPDLLPAVSEELGLHFYPRDSHEGREAAARALAMQAVCGRLTARQLAGEIHRHFGHTLPLAERLALLDDEYDLREYSERSTDDIDQEVMAQAIRLAHHHRRPGTAEDG
jgi:hypothetical protein